MTCFSGDTTLILNKLVGSPQQLGIRKSQNPHRWRPAPGEFTNSNCRWVNAVNVVYCRVHLYFNYLFGGMTSLFLPSCKNGLDGPRTGNFGGGLWPNRRSCQRLLISNRKAGGLCLCVRDKRLAIEFCHGQCAHRELISSTASKATIVGGDILLLGKWICQIPGLVW